MIQRKHILFPLVLVGLTFILALAVGLLVSPRTAIAPVEEGITPVTESGYREDARTAIAPVLATQDETGVPMSADAVAQAYDALLTLSVPSSYKEVHIGLVTSLHLLRDGLSGNEEARVLGGARFVTILQNNPWLN